ncbi:C6 zinc finger domain-containing protein [Phlyctema vagabunda]|uniref:C6 zinc finger domain-containing protein n=1 Tax=Phlyctema vagabunda TaxID=108571 RepID=A0ABR4PB60_9HELO
MAFETSHYHIMQKIVPQKAFTQPLLLHGILAFSALHQAFQRSDNAALLSLAFQHHRHSIVSHRNALENLRKETWEMLFVSASFIAVYIAAMGRFPRLHGIETWTSTPLDTVVDFSKFLQGVLAVVMNSIPWLNDSELEPLLCRNVLHMPLPQNNNPVQSLIQLQTRIEASGASSDMVETYVRSIDKLQSTFHQAKHTNYNSAVVLNWLVLSSDAFLAAVRSQNPMALTILAHHCVLLHMLHGAWWSKGWGKQLVLHIHAILDKDWQPSIQWAMQEIGV